LKSRFFLAILIVQSVLFLSFWFLYRTWTDFWWPLNPSVALALRITIALLSVSFVLASLLSFRSSNKLVSAFYWAAAVWMGVSNFLFLGAWLALLADLVLRLSLADNVRLPIRPYIGDTLLVAVAAVAVYGLLNARQIRRRQVEIRLPNLPPSWHGRTALLITDVHLGPINGARFSARIAAFAQQLNPAIIFIAGDLYDGTKIDPKKLASPLLDLSPPFGIYFAAGNHEEFGNASQYEETLRNAGVRVLHNERVVVDGLQIIGVPYGPSTHPLHLRAFLESLSLKDGPASILLNHVPNGLPVAEDAGVSLQLSGHTHRGQFFPFTLITRRAFGKFTYGLQRFGNMQVYTSSGAGTWGPPMRVGTHAEIVLLNFE
jgi:uncharacterized protein